MHELDALKTCVDALYSLTPAERERAMDWLEDRVHSDLAKEKAAAISVGRFLRAVA